MTHAEPEHIAYTALLSPDRWLLWLGVLFVLSVYHFPTGVAGRLRLQAARRDASVGRAKRECGGP